MCMCFNFLFAICHRRKLFLSLILLDDEPLSILTTAIAAFCFESCLAATLARPLENIASEVVFASPVVTCMSCSSYLDNFRDGSQVAVQLLFRGVLLPGYTYNVTGYFYE